MKFHENTSFLVVLGIIIFILYSIFAIRPLSTELQMTPEWTVDILKKLPQNQTSQEAIENTIISTEIDKTATIQYPFKLGQILGYFTKDGIITSISTFPYKATISDSYWSSYTPDATNIIISDKAGKQVGIIDDGGFPFFDENRIYLFYPGGISLGSYTQEGKRNWIYENYVPIISFSSSPSGAIAGFADGKVISFRQDGTEAVSFFPGGSNYQIIFGVDISNSGELMACVSGIDQQRFILSKNMNGHNKVLFHKYVEGNVQEPTFVKFSQDDSKIYYNYDGGLGIVDCNTLKSSEVKIEGKVIAIEESSIDGITFVLSKNKDLFYVYILEDLDYLIGSFHFKANNAFIKTGDDALYVGADTSISRISLTRQ